MATGQAGKNHWDKWDLTLYLQWRIYTSIPTWTHSQNSLAAEALSLKISSNGKTSQMTMKTISVSMRIVLNYAMKEGITFESDRKSMKTETTTRSELLTGVKTTVEQVLVSE